MGMDFLKELRKRKGFDSRYKMAKFLGMLEASYSYLENKAKGCELQTLVDIKQKCGLTWNQLGKMIEDEVNKK